MRNIRQPNLQTAQWWEEYKSLDDECKEALSFREFCELQRNEGNQRTRDRIREKIEIPKFNGEEKGIRPLVWLQKLEQLFKDKPRDDDEKIRFATLHLEGLPYEWWLNVDMDTQEGLREKFQPWQEFREQFLSLFDSKRAEDHFCKLINLRQVGSLKEYTSEFLRLSLTVRDPSIARIVSLYIEGLMGDVKADVLSQQPRSLDEARRLAKVYDKKSQMLKTGKVKEASRNQVIMQEIKSEEEIELENEDNNEEEETKFIGA